MVFPSKNYSGLITLTLLLVIKSRQTLATDWPMWRFDAGRTASTPQMPLKTPHLAWKRQLPPLTPAYRDRRLQFDAGYEPVVAEKFLVVGSSLTDSVTAYETETGKELWRFYTDGPVRFAPAIWNGRVYFGSDDGYLYCLLLKNGAMHWKFQAVPSARKVLGNKRLISNWPVRGGVVIDHGHVYFAAGVYSFEGVFVFSLDAVTGKKIWVNDRLGYIYGIHPHQGVAMGGLTPQGYLIVNGDELIVPCSAAYPARVNRHTGERIAFELPSKNRRPGGWFGALDKKTAKAIRRGKLIFDNRVNRQLHENGLIRGTPESGARRMITMGGENPIQFDEGYANIQDEIHTMVAADEKILVVTGTGWIHCFSDKVCDTPKIYSFEDDRIEKRGMPHSPHLKSILESTPALRGYALVSGLEDGQLLEALARYTQFHIIGMDSDARKIAQLRSSLDRSGLYGSHISLIMGLPHEINLPPYIFSVITTENPSQLLNASSQTSSGSATTLEKILQALRPFGGTAFLPLSRDEHVLMESSIKASQNSQSFHYGSLDNLSISRKNNLTLIRREGALTGSTNYTGNWTPSDDSLVRSPLGVLWFDDSLGHFKRSPQPRIVDGVMISRAKSWENKHLPPDEGYDLKQVVLSDPYTGRILGKDEARDLRPSLPDAGPDKNGKYLHRPPSQNPGWIPDPPRPGRRINPMTGLDEPRVFPKSYGCDGGFDYGSLFTMRSATAAFYDKTIESGTIYISGPRSGCTNSVIPANGLLNVPYFFEGCTCGYPLPVGLALVSMPETHEQWATWGDGQPGDIQRVGINFGAPGDRMTREGTLWLDYPNVGGPSPELLMDIEPENPEFYYHHSVWIEGGYGWPWVVASGVEGMASFTLKKIKPGAYKVRLYFAEHRDNLRPGDRQQSIWLQDKNVTGNLDVVQTARGNMRGVVLEFTDVNVVNELAMRLVALNGQTLLSGLEIVRTGNN